MNRIWSIFILSLGLLMGLFSFYIWISTVFSEAVYAGMAGIAANLAVNIFVLLFSGFFITFSVWRGKLHEKRSLAILFLISAVLFLAVCINMVSRYAISFPQPSQEWLASMALSRAHTLEKAPVIDDLLLTQGRMVTLGMGVISLAAALILAWFGKSWFQDKTQA